MFKENLSTSHDVPATVEYKDGQTVWLEIPISIVKDRMKEKQDSQNILDEKARIAKDKKLKAKQKRERERENMGVGTGQLGQGEIFKF